MAAAPAMHFRETLTAFVEDTGLLIGMAYLLARHRTLATLFQKKMPLDEAGRLGLIFGFVGMTGVLLPHGQSPYDTALLITALATVIGGSISGFVCALTVTIVALFAAPWPQAGARLVSLLLTILVSRLFRRFDGSRFSVTWGLAAGAAASLTQSALLHASGMDAGDESGALAVILMAMANGFGVAVVITMFNDAWIRANAEQHRLEAERSRTLATQAQLGALRARIHPHFLYNALASIAGLCAIAPDRAQDAIVRLGDLIRRTLEASATTLIPLKSEIENVETYLAIEQTRLDERLKVCWDVDTTVLETRIPPLALQTLVENAVNHGVASRLEPGTVHIRVRRSGPRTVVAVQDDGPGMPAAARRSIQAEAHAEAAQIHGLPILSSQLVLLNGPRARLRAFSRPDCGTLVAFAVPSPVAAPRRIR